MRDYRFVKVTRGDLPMLRGWLEQPHVRAWWGDAGGEAAMMTRDLNSDIIDMRIVTLDAVPFAYAQDYDAQAYDAPQYADLPHGTRAVDTFLGAPEMLGQGHAKAYLRARAVRLIDAGAAGVAVDPDPRNETAIATYFNAGFIMHAVRPCEDGDPVQVMTFTGHNNIYEGQA